MLVSWDQLTFYPLKWISLGGLHPDNDTKLAKVQFWLNFMACGAVIILAAIEIWISYTNNIYYAIESILTIVLYLHIISKYTILSNHKSTLGHLLKQRSKFWKIEDFEPAVRTECEKIMTRSYFIVKSYLGYSLSVVISFLIQPILTGQLPVFLYVPNGCYYYLFATFYFVTPAIMASIWGVDTIFYSISMPASVQLKLLAHKFENLDLTNICEKSLKVVRGELKQMVDYHNFLIRYCKTINEMCSGIFLTQFLVAIATSCMQLFIASQPEFGLVNKIKCVSYFTMQIVETAIYCFTTELISERSAEVGNAVYKSNWYDIPVNSVKKDINSVIVRSQKRVVFSGLGLVWINMETFTRIFKTALSFYTYLNTMVYND